jgi:hypothetical protein
MPFPPAIDENVRKRFSELIAEGLGVASGISEANARAHREARQLGVISGGSFPANTADYQSLRAKALNLIDYVGASKRFADEIRKGSGISSDAQQIVGILQGLADDYANGFLDSVIRRAEAEVAADYLGQAESLLAEGQSGKFDHIPAAVLLGALLEQGLRALCGRRVPPVPVLKANGEKIMMNGLIDDLKKAGVFNELKAKQLRAWAAIRNAAAHGEFATFGRTDVEGMQQGIATFLADHL